MTNIGDTLSEEEVSSSSYSYYFYYSSYSYYYSCYFSCPQVMLLINAADKNGDGYIDFEEFVKIMMY